MLYTISLFTPLVAPYTQYPLYVVKCGGLPLSTLTKGAYKVYKMPGDPVYGANIFTSGYFCTEQEAQAAGFHRSD